MGCCASTIEAAQQTIEAAQQAAGQAVAKTKEGFADLKANLGNRAEEMKDDWAEFNLARRAKVCKNELDKGVMSAKEQLMLLEDADDGVILLYGQWSKHRSDLLQLPSLSSWARREPFLGGAEAASELQTAATAQMEMTQFLIDWREKEVVDCVRKLGEAKGSLRRANKACNDYIEAEIKLYYAAKKHKETTEQLVKATAAHEEAEKAAAAEPAAAAAADADGDAPTAADGESATPTRQLTKAASKVAVAQKKLEDAQGAVEAALAVRTAEEEARGLARKAAMDTCGLELATADVSFKGAFTAFRSGYERVYHSSKGVLASPDLARASMAYTPDDAEQTQADAGANDAEKSVVLGESTDDAGLRELYVGALLHACEAAERATRKAGRNIEAWKKHGVTTTLGPAGAGKGSKGQDGLTDALVAQLEKTRVASDPAVSVAVSVSAETIAVVKGAVFAGRKAAEEAFMGGAVSAMADSEKALQTWVSQVAASCKEWLESNKKRADAQATLDAKVAAAEADKDKDDDDKTKKQPPSAGQVAEVDALTRKVDTDYEQLMSSARDLKGGGALSVSTLYLVPLKQFLQATTDFVCARGTHGFFEPPSDGVVHLEEVPAASIQSVAEAEPEAVEIKMAEEIVQQEKPAASAAAWGKARSWYKNMFEEDADDEDRQLRLAGKIVANWTSLQQTGDTVDDATVVAMGIDLDCDVSAGVADGPAAAPAPVEVEA